MTGAGDRGPADIWVGRWFVLGLLAWLAAQVILWPASLSFGDEVGYLGQVRVLLTGHVRPQLADPGFWLPGDHGLVGKYPLFLPLVVAPLFAIEPRLVFAVGVGAALVLTVLAARILRMWGRSPIWALLLLAHPTVVIIARTVMVDLLLSVFVVGAWYALARRRLATACALLALVVVAKPTGILMAMALVAGDALGFRGTAGAGRAAARRLGWTGGGVVIGVALTAFLNYLATGSFWYGYARQNIGTPLFSLAHVSHALPFHLLGLLLCPPLLVLGAVPLWKRRALGPLFVVVGLVAAMGCYFFVDRGRTLVETLVLAPRLVLPAVALLLIGYADLLAGLAARIGRGQRLVVVAVAALPAALCLGLAARHQGWQRPQAAALAAARLEAARLHPPELGLSGGAFKAGMLFRGRTISVGADGANRPAVVLCGEASGSYRDPGASFRCQLPDYDDRALAAGFHLLVRR